MKVFSFNKHKYHMNILTTRSAWTFGSPELAELKLHLSIGFDDLDSLITSQVEPAIAILEDATGLAARDLTWTFTTDEIESFQKLPYRPVKEIVSIQKVLNNTQSTVSSSDYRLLSTGEVQWITIPNYDSRPDAIVYTYKQKTNPARATSWKRAIYAYVGGLLNNREEGIEQVYGTKTFTWADRIISSLREEVNYV